MFTNVLLNSMQMFPPFYQSGNCVSPILLPLVPLHVLFALQSLIIIIFTMHSLLLILLATLSLAQSSTNITLPPFVPVPPKQPTNTSLPYGSILNHCYIPGTVALTFDDGPYIYTSRVLDVLAHHGARATFFINGRNRGHIDQFPELVKRAHEEGHQLGSHT